LEEREQSLSFTEFSYMLLQAWDFLQLYDRHQCELQLGGSDQWGNIVEGIDLIRRQRGAIAFGLTSPLVTKADGSKFGKTEEGSVWLDPERTRPYDFFQYWLRSADAEVGSFLRRFTFLPRERIEELEEAAASHPERRDAQRTLAIEVTSMVHGAEEAGRAEAAASALFANGIAKLDRRTLEIALADAPTTVVSAGELDDGLSLVDALTRTKLATSNRDARQLLSAGSIYVNDLREREDRSLGSGDLLHGGWLILRRGKAKQHVLAVRG
jgi:tyrosyl-tRNA synthetase